MSSQKDYINWLSTVKQHKDFNSGKLSERSFVVSLAVLGLSWTVLIGSNNHLSRFPGGVAWLTSVLSILSLLFDFCQYLYGYIEAFREYSRSKSCLDTKNFSKNIGYQNQQYPIYKQIIFSLKIICSSLSILIFSFGAIKVFLS